MAAFVLLGNADGLFDLSFSQAAGNGGSKFARLLPSLAEGDLTINHDGDRPGRHDGGHNDDGLGSETQVAPDRAEIKAVLADLQQDQVKKGKVQKMHRVKI